MRDGEAAAWQQEQTGGETGTLTQSLAGAAVICWQLTFQTLHAASQDGSFLEFFVATSGRACNIQDAREEVCDMGVQSSGQKVFYVT